MSDDEKMRLKQDGSLSRDLLNTKIFFKYSLWENKTSVILVHFDWIKKKENLIK